MKDLSIYIVGLIVVLNFLIATVEHRGIENDLLVIMQVTEDLATQDDASAEFLGLANDSLATLDRANETMEFLFGTPNSGLTSASLRMQRLITDMENLRGEAEDSLVTPRNK